MITPWNDSKDSLQCHYKVVISHVTLFSASCRIRCKRGGGHFVVTRVALWQKMGITVGSRVGHTLGFLPGPGLQPSWHTVAHSCWCPAWSSLGRGRSPGRRSRYGWQTLHLIWCRRKCRSAGRAQQQCWPWHNGYQTLHADACNTPHVCLHTEQTDALPWLPMDRQDRAPGDCIYLLILLVVLQRDALTAVVLQVVASGDLSESEDTQLCWI